MSNRLLNTSVVRAVEPPAARDKMTELQRLAELGRLSATLLHEISNPLTAALLHLEQAEHPNSSAVREAKRSIQMLKKYVEAARQQVRKESALSDFKIRTSVNQVKRVVTPLANKAGVNLIVEAVPDCRLYGDPVKFQQVLANLLVNAVEAYQDATINNLIKIVRLKITFTGHFLNMEVTDWGQGISGSQLQHVFEPFYTTKRQAGHGLGIGLAIVHQYVTHDFGGSIVVSSSRRYGTRFKVCLPALYRPAT